MASETKSGSSPVLGTTSSLPEMASPLFVDGLLGFDGFGGGEASSFAPAPSMPSVDPFYPGFGGVELGGSFIIPAAASSPRYRALGAEVLVEADAEAEGPGAGAAGSSWLASDLVIGIPPQQQQQPKTLDFGSLEVWPSGSGSGKEGRVSWPVHEAPLPGPASKPVSWGFSEAAAAEAHGEKSFAATAAVFAAPIGEPQVPPPPVYLERNATFVSTHSPASIMARLRQALEELDADYDDEASLLAHPYQLNGVAYIDNHTVSFVAAVYAATPESYYVEFQRRSGCVMIFNQFFRLVASRLGDLVAAYLEPSSSSSSSSSSAAAAVATRFGLPADSPLAAVLAACDRADAEAEEEAEASRQLSSELNGLGLAVPLPLVPSASEPLRAATAAATREKRSGGAAFHHAAAPRANKSSNGNPKGQVEEEGEEEEQEEEGKEGEGDEDGNSPSSSAAACMDGETVECLLSLAASDLLEVQREGLRTLASLSASPANQRMLLDVAQPGLMGLLNDALQSKDGEVARCAAVLLGNLCEQSSVRELICDRLLASAMAIVDPTHSPSAPTSPSSAPASPQQARSAARLETREGLILRETRRHLVKAVASLCSTHAPAFTKHPNSSQFISFLVIHRRECEANRHRPDSKMSCYLQAALEKLPTHPPRQQRS